MKVVMKMKRTYSKNYFEKYAAMTLLSILQLSADMIIIDDCPDLRLPVLNMGIEVTQALTPKEAVADIKQALYASGDLNPFDQKESHIPFVLQKISHAIERKQKKSAHYKSYDCNGLYIFSHCHNLDADLLLAYFYGQRYHDLFYQQIYINCISEVYVYHLQTQQLVTYHYQAEDLSIMNEEALAYEAISQKERRQIIL